MQDKPDKPTGEIMPFHHRLVEKLQDDLRAARHSQDDALKGSRLYWQRVQAVHGLVLLLLDTESLAHCVGLLQEDAPRLLGLPAAQLFIAALPAEGVIPHQLTALKRLPASCSWREESFMVEDSVRLASLFPRQEIGAVLALPFAVNGVQAVLALAADNGSFFSLREPFQFLVACVARKVRGWLV